MKVLKSFIAGRKVWNVGDEIPEDLAVQLVRRGGLVEGIDGPGDAEASSEDLGDIPENIADIMKWVGDDPDRMQAALDAELAKDKPRSTLVDSLTEALDTEED